MGRGLSPLQKTIMEIVDRQGSVDTADVLEEYYRLIPAKLLTHRQRVEAYKPYRWSLYEKPEFVEWNPQEGRYQFIYAESQRVATGRAFRRLGKRGLLQESWHGWEKPNGSPQI